MIFDPGSNILDESMGQIPAAVLQTEGRIRGNHPIDSFAALGPCAALLVGVQTPQDVYAPVRELSKQDGYGVLIGVGLNKLTALHLAEKMAGRQLSEGWVLGENGQPMQAALGDCSDGFGNLDHVLAPIEQRAYVGKSLWRVFPIRPALELAAEAIRTNPAVTDCGRLDCAYCTTTARIP
jgi:aminoglycoside 3-N-acetyltransferase